MPRRAHPTLTPYNGYIFHSRLVAYIGHRKNAKHKMHATPRTHISNATVHRERDVLFHRLRAFAG